MKKCLSMLLLLFCIIGQNTFPVYGNEQEDETIQNDCEKFEDGSEVVFQNNDEWLKFAYYYISNYEMNNCKIHYYSTGGTVKISEEGVYDRDHVVKDILSMFGSVSGNTTEEIINNTCNTVTTNIQYNKNYVNSTIEDTIKDKQGVCWQIAKICAIVLRNKGIPCDIIYGYVGRNIQSHETTHMWLKCNVGERTIYADPLKGVLTNEDYNENYQEISFSDWTEMLKKTG